MTLAERRSLSDRDVRRDVSFNRQSDALSDQDVDRDYGRHAATWDLFERPEISRLDLFAQLPANWDSYGAKAIDPLVIERVQSFLRMLVRRRGLEVLPRVTPTVVGGLSMEWRNDRGELAIELEPTADEYPRAIVFVADAISGLEWEGKPDEVPGEALLIASMFLDV